MKRRVSVESGFRWLGTGISDTLLRTKITFTSVNGRKYLKNLRSYKLKKKVFRDKQLTCAKFGHIFPEIPYIPFRYIDLFFTSFL